MKPFLSAEWRDLVLLNYQVDPSLLLPHVPRGTELDLWESQALLSLVGFRFADTRVLGVPVPGHRHFPEVNLRFYVRRVAPHGVRRAVVFLRELVPRRAIAWLARAQYNEPYRALPMRSFRSTEGESQLLRYEWFERDWVGVEARTQGPPTDLRRGSQAEFITEHFWGYTRQRDGGTVEYHVSHPSWRLWESPQVRVTGSLAQTYGPELGAVLARAPVSAFVAEGSPVTVYRPRRLAAGDSGSVLANDAW